MPRRREVLRLAGATAAAGVGTALAGCTARSSSGDGEGRLDRWLYDPAEYGSDWEGYQVYYIEPAALASNETYLNESMLDWLTGSSWTTRDRVDYQLQAGVVGGAGTYPLIAIYEGAFGIGSARSAIAEGSTRAGAHDGRALYRVESGGYAAIDHGELWFVGTPNRAGAEAYFDSAGEHSFVADEDRFARFFDRVGVGTYTTLELANDGVGLRGYSYHVDGPTTTARSLRRQPLTERERQAVERRVDRARARFDPLRDISFEYEDGEALLSVELETSRALLVSDPVEMYNLGY